MRLVVIPRYPEAYLRRQRTREKMVVVYSGAIRVLQPVAFEVALRWASSQSEYRRLKNCWALVTQSRAQPVPIAKIGVYLCVNEIRVLMESQQREIIV